MHFYPQSTSSAGDSQWGVAAVHSGRMSVPQDRFLDDIIFQSNGHKRCRNIRNFIVYLLCTFLSTKVMCSRWGRDGWMEREREREQLEGMREGGREMEEGGSVSFLVLVLTELLWWRKTSVCVCVCVCVPPVVFAVPTSGHMVELLPLFVDTHTHTCT